MRVRLLWFSIVGAGCNPAPPSTPAPESAVTEVVPLDQGPPAVPVPDPHATDCPTHYTSNDANAVFGAARNLEAGDCTFDGVRVRGSRLTLTWLQADQSAVTVTYGPAGCVTGAPYGDHAIESEAELGSACPTALSSLQGALTARSLPTATGTLSLGTPGPDGAALPPPSDAKPPPAAL